MKKAIPLIAFYCVASWVCVAETIYIPGDYPTIQAGIDAAAPGDFVLVASGTYVENLDFDGKAILVKSEEGFEFIAIDGSCPVNPERGSVVVFHHGEGNDSKLQGFALINGTGTYHGLPSDYEVYCGGGFFCDNASPTIIDCLIKDNSSQFGGGMYNGNHSDPIVSQCSFEFNYSSKGGGMYSGKHRFQ